VIYFIGFDLLYGMNKYGLITFKRKEKNNEILFEEIVFYQEKIDPSLDSLKYIKTLFGNMDNASSFEELDSIHIQVEQELLKVFRVRDKSALFNQKSGEFENFYGTSPIKLLQEKHHIYTRNIAKLEFLQKGIHNFGQDHIELVIVEKRIKDFYRNRDEYIELMGLEQYNERIESLLSTKESLLNNMNIDENDLELILS